MTADEPRIRRLALALLRLLETGDQAAAGALVEGLDVDELRAVLTAQTWNLTLLFVLVFDGPTRESDLPGLAAQFGRTRAEVTDSYLDQLILKLASSEVQ